MNDLLNLAVKAHGGMDQWKKFARVGVDMQVSGVLWSLKGQDGVLNNSRIEVNLAEQRGKYICFDNEEGQETDFSRERVAIINKRGLVGELSQPRDSFSGHQLETPWTKLQLVYFGTYAMWEYLTIPFSLLLPGFETKELSPWHEGGETWRRLWVSFPDRWAYHSKEQVLYFDEKGLLKRLDYNVEISGNSPAAQYVFDYRDVQGIKVPCRRLVYVRDENNHYLKEPLIVGIRLLNVQFY